MLLFSLNATQLREPSSEGFSGPYLPMYLQRWLGWEPKYDKWSATPPSSLREEYEAELREKNLELTRAGVRPLQQVEVGVEVEIHLQQEIMVDLEEVEVEHLAQIQEDQVIHHQFHPHKELMVEQEDLELMVVEVAAEQLS